jgi:hypothetical protein
MAWAGKVVVKLTNTAVAQDNYQIVDFDFDATTGTEAECVAGVIAYLASCGASDAIAEGTSIVEVTTREAADPGGVPQPFPVAAYTALLASATPPPTPGVLAFPIGLGGGALAPLGTSISVSERTLTPGPHGRGRHFLPFTPVDAVNGGGQLIPAIAALIETYYDEFIFNTAGTGDLIPVVRPGGVYSGGNPVTLVKAQPVFSNLESRRR